MKKIKVAVIGSAATRGCFDLHRTQSFRDVCEVSLMQYQSSMMSIMSPPVQGAEVLQPLGNMGQKIFTEDIKKTLWERLREFAPDVVVIDVVADVLYGTLQFENAFVTNKKTIIEKVRFSEPSTEFSLHTHPKEYMERWKRSFEAFLDVFQRDFPHATLVWHTPVFVNSYIDETNQLKSLRRYDTHEKNQWLHQFEECVPKDIIPIINLSKRKYHTTKFHPWKKSFIHYETPYYRDFLMEFYPLLMKHQWKSEGEKIG